MCKAYISFFFAQGFDELLELAEKGDHRNVDMQVKDIYGGAYSALGLPSDLIASSFGKVAKSSKDRQCNQIQILPLIALMRLT